MIKAIELWRKEREDVSGRGEGEVDSGGSVFLIMFPVSCVIVEYEHH